MRKPTITILLMYLVLVPTEESAGQLPGNLDRFYHNRPVTTSFAEARWEVEALGNYRPDATHFRPLNSLPRTREGQYRLYPGLYALQSLSFSIGAGIEGPSGENDYLFAGLEGPRAVILETILARWPIRHPEISRNDIQLVIWAILAGMTFGNMRAAEQRVLLQLMDKAEIEQALAGSQAGSAQEKGMAVAGKEAVERIRLMAAAEEKIRRLFQEKDVPYERFEELAVPAAQAFPAKKHKEGVKGRWSFHPGGYFIRYLPMDYRCTRVEIYQPLPVEYRTDGIGRIESLGIDGCWVAFVYRDAVQGAPICAIKIFASNGKVRVVPLLPTFGVAMAGKKSGGREGSGLPVSMRLPDSLIMDVYNLQAAGRSLLGYSQLIGATGFFDVIGGLMAEAANFAVYKALRQRDFGDSVFVNLAGGVATPSHCGQLLAVTNSALVKPTPGISGDTDATEFLKEVAAEEIGQAARFTMGIPDDLFGGRVCQRLAQFFCFAGGRNRVDQNTIVFGGGKATDCVVARTRDGNIPVVPGGLQVFLEDQGYHFTFFNQQQVSHSQSFSWRVTGLRQGQEQVCGWKGVFYMETIKMYYSTTRNENKLRRMGDYTVPHHLITL